MDAKHQIIPAGEFEQAEEEAQFREHRDASIPYSEIAQECRALTGIANQGNGVSRISVPRDLSRKKIIDAFTDAFDLIGGVPRFAYWADSNPGDFYKLFARMIPSEANSKINATGEWTIRHVVPRGPLDE